MTQWLIKYVHVAEAVSFRCGPLLSRMYSPIVESSIFKTDIRGALLSLVSSVLWLVHTLDWRLLPQTEHKVLRSTGIIVIYLLFLSPTDLGLL